MSLEDFFIKVTTMQIHNKFLSMLALAGLFLAAGCSDDTENDPDPTPTEPTCQLTSISEVEDQDVWNVTLTYDAAGNLTKREDPDGALTFTYIDGKISTMSFGEVTGEFSYNGGTWPNRFEYEEDGDSYFMIMRYSGEQIASVEYHYLEEGEDILESVTEITYNAAGNPTRIEYKNYDRETETFEVSTTIDGITTDDKKNPYAGNFALAFYEAIDGDEANLGVNNPVTARYNYGFGDPTDVVNTYEYNDEGYPTKRVQTGFSDITTYNLGYNCK